MCKKKHLQIISKQHKSHFQLQSYLVSLSSGYTILSITHNICGPCDLHIFSYVSYLAPSVFFLWNLHLKYFNNIFGVLTFSEFIWVAVDLPHIHWFSLGCGPQLNVWIFIYSFISKQSTFSGQERVEAVVQDNTSHNVK